MAHQQVETNPHFIEDLDTTMPEQRHYLPAALLPRRGHHQRVPRQGLEDPGQRPQPLGLSPPEPHHESQTHLPLHVWVPPPVQLEDQRSQSQPRPSSIQGPTPKEVMLQSQLQDQYPSSSSIRPQGEITEGDLWQGRHPQEHRPHSSLFLRRDRRTNPLTWSAATFCIIFWLIMIIGGLVVLIAYLVFRPCSPLFNLNGVTLNAASLNMGYLPDADPSLLANFTNPNKKVRIDFRRMYLDIYFEKTLIATQYMEPFSAAKGQSMFANIHMITRLVRLSMKETLLFQKQIENNQVMFTVKGVFRDRSRLGGFLKYSYWLRGYCGIMVSSPPTGVLREKNCITKH